MSNSLRRNIILDIDSYKNDHGEMLPEDTQYIFSTIVPRRGNRYTNTIKAMGHQYAVKKYITEPVEAWMLDEAETELREQGFSFNRERWQHILDKHNGYLPLEIRAVPEGMLVPVGVATVTIVNTDPQCAWLSSYIETMFQRVCWKMTTVASIALDLYRYLDDMMIKQSGEAGKVNFHLHNFGSRGADSYEADILAGMAHLSAGFNGTDCAQANRNIKHFYNTTKAYGMSVSASEHSVMCTWSDSATCDDLPAVKMMIDLLEYKIKNQEGLPTVSIVGDTYDIYRLTRDYIGGIYRDKIIELGALGGKVVVRPDSGDPLTMCMEVIKILMDKFGYSVNKFGYKVLPPYIGVIQGDGINNDSIRHIVARLDKARISLENIVFGMGSGLTHDAGRDEFSFSMKATARYDGAVWHDLLKRPITDLGKQSLKGHISTYISCDGQDIYTERIEEEHNQSRDLMQTIYRNGKCYQEYTFDEVISHNQR
ncbi:MAG: nicotinate phosphoribosyltransferase [Burkholderiales bacterium]|nr:nicotinate phosphoribosyltransferase [Burkholderiales bacterium]